MPRSDDEMAQPIIQDQDNDHHQEHHAGHSDNELDPELTGCGATACCNPSHGVHRFIALVFMCFLGFGSYFCYDNPAALQDYFERDLNLSKVQFAWLYSIYSWPNVVLCFLGGFLIDRVFGIRMGTIIFLFIVLSGQILFAVGGILNAYWIMLVGRFIFGVGAESLAVAQNNYAVLWFKGKELNMVFGLQLSFARVGSTVNFMVMEPLYNYVSQHYHSHAVIGVVLLLTSFTCVLSFLCALILCWMDKRAQRILQRNESASGEIARLTDIGTFKLPFWMVSVICAAYYVAIFPFIAIGKLFFKTKFGFTPEQANAVNSIVYIIAAAASPIFGFVIDKTGRNVSWVCAAIMTTIGAHLILAVTYLNPYVGMIIMGISYSMLASSLWPLVALIVPEYQLGTAYGICQSVQNLGLAVNMILSGVIVDHSDGNYLWVELFFIGYLIVSLLATIVLWIYNSKTKGILNMTPRKRIEHAQLVSAATVARLIESDSVDDISPDQVSSEAGFAVRNRLNNTVRENNFENSDQEPLLS